MSMQKSFKKMGTAINRVFTKMIRIAKLAVVALIGVGIAAVKMAADVEDSEDFFEMAMGSMADATRKWSEELSDALYLNAYEIRETVAIFNEMITAMGMTEKAAASMSQKWTKMAYDLVSYHPKVKTLAQASIVLQSALTGEREVLKRLGYYYSENEVKLKAIELGYGANINTLTQLQKLEVNEIILMEKMKNVQGDLARTINNSQNVFRTLWDTIKVLVIELGDKLKPTITKVALSMRKWLTENKEDIKTWASAWLENLEWITKKIWEWRKEIAYVAIALGALTVIIKVITLLTILSTALWAAIAAVGAFLTVTLGLPVALIAAGAVISRHITHVGYEVWQLEKTIDKVTESVMKLGEAERKMAVEQGYRLGHKRGESPLVKAAREYSEILKQQWIEARRPQGLPLVNLAALVKATKEQEKAAASMYEMTMKAKGLSDELAKERELLEFTTLARKAYGDTLQAVAAIERYKSDLATTILRKEEELAAKVLREQLEERQRLSKVAEDYAGIMRNALQEEYGLLGKISEERERSISIADYQAEVNKITEISAERRNQLMLEYGDLLDRIIVKQNSLSYAILQWYDKASQMGRNLGSILTRTFDSVADSFADMLMKQEADWKAFGQMFIKQLLTMIIKLQMAYALQTMLGFGTSSGGLLGGLFGGGGGSTFTNPMAVMGAPAGLAEGGEVTQSGWAKVDKGEVFSGVNNEQGFGNTIVNISDYAGVDIVVDEYKDSDQRIIDVTLAAAAGNGSYRRTHKLV